MRILRNESAEQAFRRRYNKNIKCEQGRDLNEDSTIKQATTIITSAKNKKYTLDEFLKDNLTDYVVLSYDEITRNFKTYLEAEVFVADEIGKEE